MKQITQHEAWAYAQKHDLKTPEDHLKHITSLLAKPKRRSPMEHWQRVLRDSNSLTAKKIAEERLKKYTTREREPGEDDEFYANEPMLNV